MLFFKNKLRIVRALAVLKKPLRFLKIIFDKTIFFPLLAVDSFKFNVFVYLVSIVFFGAWFCFQSLGYFFPTACSWLFVRTFNGLSISTCGQAVSLRLFALFRSSLSVGRSSLRFRSSLHTLQFCVRVVLFCFSIFSAASFHYAFFKVKKQTTPSMVSAAICSRHQLWFFSAASFHYAFLLVKLPFHAHSHRTTFF